jgi:ATP-dependent HslUV protease ATP-binding subunit HslU
MAIYCSTTLDQGRLPIRVTLKGLSQEDMYRILTEPVTNLIRQQVEMLKSEDVTLAFTDDAIKEIARVAFEVLHVEITAWIKSTSILD